MAVSLSGSSLPLSKDSWGVREEKVDHRDAPRLKRENGSFWIKYFWLIPLKNTIMLYSPENMRRLFVSVGTQW